MVRKSSRKNYTGFSLEKEIVEEIRQYMTNHSEMHYNSIIEFIKVAIRDKINQKPVVIEVDQMSGKIQRISGVVTVSGEQKGAEYIPDGNPKLVKGKTKKV